MNSFRKIERNKNVRNGSYFASFILKYLKFAKECAQRQRLIKFFRLLRHSEKMFNHFKMVLEAVIRARHRYMDF